MAAFYYLGRLSLDMKETGMVLIYGLENLIDIEKKNPSWLNRTVVNFICSKPGESLRRKTKGPVKWQPAAPEGISDF